MISVNEFLLRLGREYSPIRIVYDCGSRDALDGLYLLGKLRAEELHIFDCNPAAVEKCRANVAEYGGKGEVFINEMAVSDIDGELSFFSIDAEKTITEHPDGNIGASSLFRANPEYPVEQYVQKEIPVTSVTLATYVHTHSVPDLLWMDLQGAELKALHGAGDVLSNVKIIHLEVSFKPMYLGQPLFWEVDAFLKRMNFRLCHLSCGRWPKALWLYRLIRTGPWVANAVYLNNRLGRISQISGR